MALQNQKQRISMQKFSKRLMQFSGILLILNSAYAALYGPSYNTINNTICCAIMIIISHVHWLFGNMYGDFIQHLRLLFMVREDQGEIEKSVYKINDELSRHMTWVKADLREIERKIDELKSQDQK
jgi:hypothetical protein